MKELTTEQIEHLKKLVGVKCDIVKRPDNPTGQSRDQSVYDLVFTLKSPFAFHDREQPEDAMCDTIEPRVKMAMIDAAMEMELAANSLQGGRK